jgi:hypothetical protein
MHTHNATLTRCPRKPGRQPPTPTIRDRFYRPMSSDSDLPAKGVAAPRHASQHLLAGGIAGTIAALVTCPLDVIKTRFQSSEFQQIGRLRPHVVAMRIVESEGCVLPPRLLAPLARVCRCVLRSGAAAACAGHGRQRAVSP